MFKLVANAFDELETLLRNIFGLTQVEKDAAIENSKEVTKSLRQQIEEAKYTIKSMEQKMQELNVIISEIFLMILASYAILTKGER
jgi:hypothetical protein